MINPFKVGDMLECIKDDPGYVTVGKKYKCKLTYPSLSKGWIVEVFCDNNLDAAIRYDYFKLISAASTTNMSPVPRNGYSIGDVFQAQYTQLIIVDIQSNSTIPYVIQSYSAVGPNFAVSIYDDRSLSSFQLIKNDATTASAYKNFITTNILPSMPVSQTTFVPSTSGTYVVTGSTGFNTNIVRLPENTNITLGGSMKNRACECGAHKTFGQSCGPESHATWCELSKS